VKLKETQPQITAFVKSKIYNEADASDIVQNVNEIVLNKESLFDPEKNFEAWAIGIAKYQIKDYLKKNKKAPDTLSLDSGRREESIVTENPALWLNDIPFADLVKEERRALRLQIRAILTPKQKAIFDLLAEGKTMKEIAEVLDMGAGTAYTLRFRLIKRAKDFLCSLNAINGYDYHPRT